MSAVATENVSTRLPDTDLDAAPPAPVLVIDQYDHWHNQDVVMLRPTSITWGPGRPTTVGRVA